MVAAVPVLCLQLAGVPPMTLLVLSGVFCRLWLVSSRAGPSRCIS
jgi:hypothetical protein